MWPKEYKNYQIDEPLIKCKVEPGKGIIGCEMHELNGWGERRHVSRKPQKRKGLFRILLESIFGNY